MPQQLLIRGGQPGHPPVVPVECGAGGATVANSGPWPVYYRDELPVTATLNDGSVASGASVTLVGAQYLTVDRGDFASPVDTATVFVSESPVSAGAGTGVVPAWAASTVYVANQPVRYGNRLWLARGAFTSGATFDASKWQPVGAESNAASAFRGLTPMTGRCQILNAPQSNGTTTTDQDYLIGLPVVADGLVERLLFAYVSMANVTPPFEQDASNAIVPVYLKRVAVEYGGTVYKLFFNGRRSAYVEPGGFLLSDPIGLQVAAGQTLRVKAHLTSAAAGTGDLTSGSATIANWNQTSLAELQEGQTLTGTGIAASTTVLSKTRTTVTMSANATATNTGVAITANGKFGRGIAANTSVDGVSNTTTDNTDVAATPTAGGGGQQAFSPVAVLGTPKAPRAIVGVIGDSVDYGQGNATLDQSFWTQALTAANIGYLSVAMGGDRASQWAAGFARQRLALMRGCTSVLVGWQTNDFAVGARTVPQFQADLLQIAAVLASWGIKVFTRTDTPRPGASGTAIAARVTANDWKRDGHPIDATTKAAVATGTSSNVLRSGDPGHPIAALPFETADAWETARNSGVWAASMDSGDGIHPSTAGHTAAQAVIAARITELV